MQVTIIAHYKITSLAESLRDIDAVQPCSVEKQKGTVAIDFV